MPRIPIREGLALHYEEFGDRSNPTVVLIRGTGADSSRWMPQVEVYKEEFHVVIFDNRGVGKSDTVPGPYTVSQMGDDTVLLLDAIGVERCHLSGSSLGGAIALDATVKHPDRIASLQMHSSWLRTHDYTAYSLGLLKKFLTMAGVDGYYELMLPLLLTAGFLSADFERTKSILAHMRANSASPEGLAAQIEANLSYDLAADAGTVRVPVLVTVGENDVLLPPSASKEIVDAIPGAEFVVFPGGAHLVTMETPAAFNDTTLGWMRRNCR